VPCFTYSYKVIYHGSSENQGTCCKHTFFHLSFTSILPSCLPSFLPSFLYKQHIHGTILVFLYNSSGNWELSRLYLGNIQGPGQDIRRHISHKRNTLGIWYERKLHSCNSKKKSDNERGQFYKTFFSHYWEYKVTSTFISLKTHLLHILYNVTLNEKFIFQSFVNLLCSVSTEPFTRGTQRNLQKYSFQ